MYIIISIIELKAHLVSINNTRMNSHERIKFIIVACEWLDVRKLVNIKS